MSKQAEAKKLAFVQTWEARMQAARTQQQAASQAINDVYANWQGYAAIASQDTDYADTAAQFAADTAAHWATIKGGIAGSLDIVAGGMGVTRQDLLNELAAL